jgi:hypothetical protein
MRSPRSLCTSLCKAQELALRQRLAYPQEHRRTVMDDLKAWMEMPFEDRDVEPTSRLGEAFKLPS